MGLGTGEPLNTTSGARFSSSRLTSPVSLFSFGFSAFAQSPCVCLLTSRSLFLSASLQKGLSLHFSHLILSFISLKACSSLHPAPVGYPLIPVLPPPTNSSTPSPGKPNPPQRIESNGQQ